VILTPDWISFLCLQIPKESATAPSALLFVPPFPLFFQSPGEPDIAFSYAVISPF
jgi:hypothetical protein